MAVEGSMSEIDDKPPNCWTKEQLWSWWKTAGDRASDLHKQLCAAEAALARAREGLEWIQNNSSDVSVVRKVDELLGNVTDENGCYTLPNGDCVSSGDCIHTERAALAASGEEKEWQPMDTLVKEKPEAFEILERWENMLGAPGEEKVTQIGWRPIKEKNNANK
ncbi:MAG: hypothetical protein C5B59_17420 [Bacteroidetes bacterium]|nr:MAG: hypothetical protein C5B59_17420 [Bacteroidota bacterium]